MRRKQNSKLIFFHIPKTAGSTLRSILYKRYAKEEIFEMKVENHQIQTQEFVSLSLEEKAHLKLLMGHMPFGLHVHFGEADCSYFTMLRDPVERTLSNYYWILKNPHHRLYHQLSTREIDLATFISDDLNPSLNNGYIKFLNNLNEATVVTENQFENTVTLLKSEFILVGITEKFNESLLLLSNLMNWKKPIHYTIKNTTANRPRKHDIDEDTIRLIIEKNKWDIKLYDWAKSRLEQQVKKYGKVKMLINSLAVEIGSTAMVRKVLSKL